MKTKYRIITRKTEYGDTGYSVQRYEGLIFKRWVTIADMGNGREIAEEYFNERVNPKPFIPQVIKESDYV